jgi:RP/EB family microtubule-associated protein
MKAVPINKSVLRPGMRPTEQDNTKPAPDSRPTVSSTSALKPAPINDSIVKEIETYKAQAEESMREAADLKLEIEDLGKERDFYFNKLREVEVALQEVVDNGQGNEISDMIFKILYATAEGFEVVNQEDAQADDGETEY